MSDTDWVIFLKPGVEMDASLSTVMRMMYTHRFTYKPKFFGQLVFWRYWQNRLCPVPKIYGACLN